MKNKQLCVEITRNIRQSFINFPHIKRISAAFDRMYDYQCCREEPENVVLLGESGVGKSTLLTKYAGKHSAIDHDEFTEIPVLYVVLGPSPSPSVLASTLLRELGDPKWYAGKEKELTARLIHLIKICRVRVVILDEANHLIDRGGEKTQHSAADWLKRLVDATRVSFVLAGIPRTKRLLETNDQFRGRFREVIEVDRFSVVNRSAEQEFRSALKVFKGYLRDIPSIDISGTVVTRLFAFATDGRLRDIRRLLVRAVELAFEQPEPRLTDIVLAESFRTVIYPNSPDERNPFHKVFDGVPLVKANEPFEPVRR